MDGVLGLAYISNIYSKLTLILDKHTIISRNSEAHEYIYLYRAVKTYKYNAKSIVTNEEL